MVPEDQSIPLRRPFFLCEANQFRQRPGITHIQWLPAAPNAAASSHTDFMNRCRSGLKETGAISRPGSSGHDKHGNILPDLSRAHHFLQVFGGRAVLAFQVASAHVDHDC